MKITETIERECCEPRDLKPYSGKFNGYSELPLSWQVTVQFCIYCGQLWREEGYTDAAGGMDTRLVRVLP